MFEPETYQISPNLHSPNSTLPILIYRDCLPLPLSEDTTSEFLQAHAWEKKGTWGHISKRHFHPNTHECYGIFVGESTLLLGCGANDAEDDGLQVEVKAGDVVVLPAGTSHCNLQSSKDYRYIGVYPEGAPHWRSELGNDPVGDKLREEVQSVAMPAKDPVNGINGPLMNLWSR